MAIISSLSGIYFLPFIMSLLTILLSSFIHSEATHESQLLIQLPKSELVSEKRAKFTNSRVLSVDDFGATGDGVTDDTEALMNVWKEACLMSQRSTILFPVGGTYLVHPVDFGGHCHSKVTLKILGTIVAPDDPAAWKGLNPRKWLHFQGLNHLTLDGGGTINGMGDGWWAQSCKFNSSMPCHHAPNAITFHKCRNLEVSDLNLVNSPQMHMTITDSFKVTLSRLRISAWSESPNTDGIHLSSTANVLVTDSIIGTGDDCISVVGNSSQILITNVVCGPGHGISIGSLGKDNTHDEIHDVVVDGALISNTENGLRIKSWQGGSGSATDIRFRNVLLRNVSNPIIIDQYYCDSSVPCENQTSAVQVDRISFVGIKGTSATERAMVFACSDSYPCQGLYLDDIQLVSENGLTSAFCWEAYGSCSGLVFPPPCFYSDDTALIRQKVSSSAINSYSG